MSDSDTAAVQAVIEALPAALDLGDREAIDTLPLPGADFSLEQQGALLDLDRETWLSLVHGRDPARSGARHALLMRLAPDAAAFTLTDRVLLRPGPQGWRIVNIASF